MVVVSGEGFCLQSTTTDDLTCTPTSTAPYVVHDVRLDALFRPTVVVFPMTLVDRAQVLEDPNLFALTNTTRGEDSVVEERSKSAAMAALANTTRDEDVDEEWSKSAGVATAAATGYQAWGNTQPLDVPLLSAVMYGVDQAQV
jgi:hypothetical protein